MIVDSDIDDLEGDVVESFHFNWSFSSVSFIVNRKSICYVS